jgi:hypothetical protein
MAVLGCAEKLPDMEFGGFEMLPIWTCDVTSPFLVPIDVIVPFPAPLSRPLAMTT